MKLSTEQQKAAYTESKKVMVLAPAGSGKTRILISRIGHLIENKNVSPYEILDFTFTRKASGELKERLEKEIGHNARNITTGTIHGVSLNYLQRFGELAGLHPGRVTVYGSWEEQFLLKEVAKELGYHSGRAWTKIKKYEVEAAFKLFYTTGSIDPDAVNENLLMNAFFARCRENNALTYGTILTTFSKIIPEIAPYLNLRHILVDEVQDLDPLQWSIINDLCKYTGASLFAIGDPNQSIFSFRGADPEYLIRNQSQFDVYNLKDNYRSSANIVDAANKLISHNHLNISEPMLAKKDCGRTIDIVEDMDSNSLANMADYYEFKNCAVIARNHWMLKKLSRLLTEAGIKHEYIGKQSGFVQSEEFRRFHAFFKLIVNSFDNFSFLMIKDYMGITNENYRQIRLDSIKNYTSHYEDWMHAGVETDQWMSWFKASETGDISTVIDWMKDIQFGFDPEPIFEFVYSWIIEHPDGTIDQYLNWLATFDVQDEIKDDSYGLQLMTAHCSKGLEFSTVIIAGLNEDIFPGSRAIKANELTEEIRLCYVALTRAENQLILTSRPIKKDKSGNVSNEPSRFIEWSI